MEPENLLPSSQDTTTGPYLEPDETNPHPPIFCLGDQFIYPAIHTTDLPSDLLLVSNIPTKILFALSSPPVCHIPCPSHSPWFDDFNDIWWGVEFVKLLISNFLDPPHYFLPLSPQILLSAQFQTPSAIDIPLMWETANLTPIQNNRQHCT